MDKQVYIPLMNRPQRKAIQFRFTERERIMLEALSEAEELNMSEVIRLLIRRAHEELKLNEKKPA